MRLRAVLPVTVLVTAAALSLDARQPPAAAARQTGPPGAAPLFDGTSLTGWRGYKKTDAGGTRWAVQDGAITLTSKAAGSGSGDLITTETFDLFDMTWEWKVAPGGNSGVKYFILEDRDSAVGHEYQIIDDAAHADAKIGPHRQTAAFYDVLPAGTGLFSQSIASPATRPVKPAGEWNTSRIRVAPSRIVAGSTRVYHYLNDVRVLEYELDSPELRAAIDKSKFKGIARFGKLQKGHILLQDHGDQVWYRSIRILRLSSGS